MYCKRQWRANSGSGYFAYLIALFLLLTGTGLYTPAATLSPPTTIIAWGDNGSGQTNVPTEIHDAISVAAGYSFALVIRSNGTVKVWGYGSSTLTNPPSGLSNVVAVAAGDSHALALRSNGTVVAWGYNSYNVTNVPANLTNAVAIAAGYYHSMALKADGTVTVWGNYSSNIVNVPSGLSNVKAIAAGGYFALALRSNGTVVAWGQNDYGQTNVPASATNIVAIAAGAYHVMALRANGTLLSWGYPSSTITNPPSGTTNIAAIACGYYHTYALRTNGTLVSWGYNFYGETNVPSGLSSVGAIAAGGFFGLALVPSQPLLVSSIHGFPIPGTGVNYFARNTAVTCSAPPYVQAGTQYVCYGWMGTGDVPPYSAGDSVVVTMTTNSSITWLWETNFLLTVTPSGGGTIDSETGWIPDGEWIPITAVPDPGYSFVGWLGDTNGCTINGLRITAPMTRGRNITALFTGVRLQVDPPLISMTGQVYGAIANQTFTLQNMGSVALTYNIASEALWLSTAVTGGTLNAGQMTNVTLRVSTRGLTSRTHLGRLRLSSQLATNMPALIPVYLTLNPAPPPTKISIWGDNTYYQTNVPPDLTNAIAFAIGSDFAAALKQDGRLSIWGSDFSTISNAAVGISDMTSLVSGGEHMLALRSNGMIRAMGNNSYGQTNVPADLSNVITVAAGFYHSMAVTEDGRVHAWGYNNYGQTNVPVGVTSVVAVAGGAYHSLALRADGSVIAWGYNYYNQTNVPPGLSNVVAISAGYYHSLALCSNGTVVGWGYNGYSQTNTPSGMTNAIAIAAGGYHSMALRANGNVTMWGNSSSGLTNLPAGLSNAVGIAALATLSGAMTPSCALTVTTPYGSPSPAPGTNWLIRDARQTFAAPTTNDGGTQYVCRGWSGSASVPASGTSNSFAVIVTNDSSVTWLWRTNYLLTVFASGGGNVNIPNGWYSDGAPVAINATALPGYTFIGWSGDTNGCVINGNQLTALMISARNIRAQFSGVAMTVQPLTMSFTGQAYSTIASQTLNINNRGTIAMDYSIVPDTFWLGVSSPTGTLLSGQSTSLAVRVSTRGLNARMYSASLTIASQGATNSPVVVPVSLGLGVVNPPTYLVGWGYGYGGQTNTPAALSNGSAIALSAGLYHSLALRSNGTVAAWGEYYDGQTNIPSGLTNVVAIAGGAYHSLALRSNGTVAAWGYNNYGQTNVPLEISNGFAVAAGYYHSMVLYGQSGIVSVWGYNGYGQTNIPSGLTNIVSISAGRYHCAALRSNGTVRVWGYTSSGVTNVPSGLSNISAIACGGYHTLALRSNGTVVAWGSSSYGQTNVPSGLSNIVSIAAGSYHSMAIRSDGRVFVWGDYGYGTTNMPPDLTNTLATGLAIAGGGYHALALARAAALDVVSSYGSPVPGAGTNWVLQGSTRSCSVTATNSFGTTQLICKGWSGTGSIPSLGTSNRITGRITTDSTLEWLWSSNYWLDTSISGPGSVDAADSWQPGGTELLINAVPVDGQTFLGWAGHTNGCTANGTTLTVPMTQARRIEAQFSRPVISLSSSNLTITGTVLHAVSAQLVTISNSGTGPLDYRLTSDMFWLSTDNTTNYLGAGQATTHMIRASSLGLNARRYVGRINVSDPLASNNPQRITVTLSLGLSQTPAIVRAWGSNSHGQTNVPDGLTNLIAAAAGRQHSLALTRNGTLSAWGDDSYGQCTIPLDSSNIMAIAGGGYHSLALQSNGTLLAWGMNSYGQVSMPSGLSSVVEIAAGLYHSMALRSNGSVVSWGSTNLAQSSVPTNLSNVVSITGGWYHSLALRSNGTIAVWGDNAQGQTNLPPGIGTAVAIAAGAYHSLALLADGTVEAWGQNALGQCNVPDGLSNVLSIAAGRFHSMAMRSDGRVIGWGLPESDQPTILVDLAPAVGIAAGGNHSLAITPMHQLIIESDQGQPSPAIGSHWLAPGSTHTLSVPDELLSSSTQYLCNGWIGIGSVPEFGSSNSVTIAITNESYLRWNWQTNLWLDLIANNGTLDSTSGWHAWGEDVVIQATNLPGHRFVGWFGDTNECGITDLSITVPMRSARSIEARFAQPEFALYMTNLIFDGQVYADLPDQNLVVSNAGTVLLSYTMDSDAFWVSVGNPAGDLAAGQSTSHTVRVGTRGLPWRNYQASLSIVDPFAVNSPLKVSIALNLHAPSPPTSVRIWGDNTYKQTNAPTTLSNAIAISAGAYHTLALRDDGSVASWGNNESRQTNCPPGLSNVVAVAAGWNHSLALKADGSIVPWGENGEGQTNVPPTVSNLVALAAGRHFSLGLSSDRSVWAWGRGSEGETNIPSAATNVVMLSAGRYHVLALRADGTLVAWGLNEYGQSDPPTDEMDLVSVAAGGHHSMALRANGTVLAWGRNDEGQSTVPSGLSNVVAIAAGLNHSMALCGDGRVWAWGDRGAGRTNVPPTMPPTFYIGAGRDHSVALVSVGTASSNAIPAWWLSAYGLTNDPTVLSNMDSDGDGMTTWEEYIADKNPTDAASFFRVDSVSNAYPACLQIEASTGRLYSLETRASLFTGTWVTVEGQSNVQGSGGVMMLIHTNPLPVSHYYRVKVATP